MKELIDLILSLIFGNKPKAPETVPQQVAPEQKAPEAKVYRVTMDELLSGGVFEEQTADIQKNLLELREKVNLIRDLYDHPMSPTNGLRTMKHHLEIYAAKGVTDQTKIPMQSKHLYGQAVDIFDPNQELQKWCLEHEAELKEIGVWLEAFESTPDWVHFQIVPYGSYAEGKSLWFKPF